MHRSILLALFSLSWRLSSAQTCYYPDGSESGDTACSNADNTEVFCCPSGSTCISDPGPTCRLSNGTYVRGSCTVQDWGSSACPRFCIAINTDNPLERCSSGSSNGRFCCGYDADKSLCDCSTNNNTFVLAKYTPIQVMAAASSTQASSSSSSTASTASAGSSSLSSATAASESTSAPSGAATTTPAAASSGLSSSQKVGLGVGIPIGLAAIGFLAFFLWRRNKKGGQLAQPGQPIQQHQQQHGYYQPPPAELPGQGAYYAPSSGYSTSPKDQYGNPLPGGYTPVSDGSGTFSQYSTYKPEQPPLVMHELPANQR